ncbi:MAG TPA: hypothetical protein VNW28_00225 [Chthoniobacterales bacterium]|jgi:hypothetical protein|nr:hypothetical protein [Chthoniobacterales bacterium]
MKSSDRQLERLLHAAAEATSEAPNEMPFGFDTRVLAHWRAGLNRDFVDVGHLLRRVVLLSLAVIALAGAGTYHELRQSDEFGELLADEYGIADSAIGNVFEQ